MNAPLHARIGRSAPSLHGIEVEEVEHIEVPPVRDYPDPLAIDDADDDPLAAARGICNGIALSAVLLAAALILVALISGAWGIAP